MALTQRVPTPSPRSNDARPALRPAPARPRSAPLPGARSPDETGMLPLAFLADADTRTVQEDPSATMFFAVPAPRRTMAPPALLPPPPSPPVTPLIQGPARFPLIQGPVASGPVTHGPVFGGPVFGGPVVHVDPRPASDAEDYRRVETGRVWAVLVGMFALFCLVTFSATAVCVARMVGESAPPLAPERQVATASPWAEDEEEEEDTGTRVEKEVPPATRAVVQPKPPPPPPPPVVKMTFQGEILPLQVEVLCADPTFRGRAPVRGGVAEVPDVPTGASCKVHPKSSFVMTSCPVKAGGTYTFRISGNVTVCG